MTRRLNVYASLLMGAMVMGGHAQSVSAAQLPQNARQNTLGADLSALINNGQYWFNRYRYDLANQAFNKVLVIQPNSAEAMKWKGLIDINSGNIQAARLWLDRLKSEAGEGNAHTVELRQTLEISTAKRQQLAELQYLAGRSTEDGGENKNWFTQLQNLFDEPPMGEAAVLYYTLQSKHSEQQKQLARAKVRQLIRSFPADPRYRKLLSDLGGETVAQPAVVAQAPAAVTAAPRPKRTTGQKATPKQVATTKPETEEQLVQQDTETTVDTAPQPAEPNDFEKGQTLAEAAQELIRQGQLDEASAKLEKAVALNPDYAWFRYDLAILMDDQGGVEHQKQARFVMETGRKLAPKDSDMVFASALLASRQNRGNDALKYLSDIPKADWTQGMGALARRIEYAQFSTKLQEARANNNLALVPELIREAPQWRAEPEVRALEQELEDRVAITIEAARQKDIIDGTFGVSRIENSQIPLQVTIPLTLNEQMFIRADRIQARAGNYLDRPDFGDLTDFGSIGRFSRQQLQEAQITPGDNALPNSFFQSADQASDGYLLGAGYSTGNWRFDLGTPVGNMPVRGWVGGMQLRLDQGPAVWRFDLARRIVGGSLLSSMGVVDPISGETWGGARRNGLTALYYTPTSENGSFVGIGRANRITGENIPDNDELNLQGIYSHTIYRGSGQTVDIGLSLYLWHFKKNLRRYTFGQGGYYSPQDFVSLSLPITWIGSMNGWSWRVQGSIGESRSREEATDLYPGRPDLADAANAAGNAISAEASNGGGDSYSLVFQLERKIATSLLFGISAAIDRSEGYNPDSINLYLKYSPSGRVDLNVPPEGLRPYAEF